MADNVNANIRVNLDTSQALAGLQSLQSRISTFNQSVIQSNAQAVAAQRNLLSTLQSQIGASGQFATSITNVENSVGRLQTAIDKNKLSMGQYFKYGVASSKNFGRVFAQENEQITRLATERVKRLQTQYLALGESQQGMTRALQVRPLQLFNADMAIATQKSQLFNRLLQDGSTSLVNWGKNTQWAGRQLMVGFTVPLTIFGGVASKIFMDLEKEAINFRKVYGDIFTTEMEVEENLAAVRELSKEMTKYGIAVKDTMALAGVAAQAGLRSADLMAATEQATRLAVLGQMEQAEAMQTIISMQTAFQQSNEELAQSVDFLNIIENQTVLSLQDVAGAIPRAAPVIQGLGGDVKDLAVLLVAMREGGVSAAEGANALKNSLARLITPTSAASGMARDFGINLEGIVERNRGEVLPTILELANAMKSLEGIDQQRLLSTIFGKFQYARIGALFKNITDDSSQAARAIELMGMSTEELATTADQELAIVEDAIGTKFTGAVELLKAEIAPIGEQFLKLATPLVEFATKVFQKFNDLSPTVKNFVTILTAGIGVILPAAIMLLGLFGNLVGSITKGIATIIGFFTKLRSGAEAVQYLSGEQLDAAAAASSLEGQVVGLTSSLNVQREAVESLTRAYTQYVAGANAAASNLPQGFRTPAARAPQAFARGGIVGGMGNKDTEPALLTPGEFVINADASKKFAPLLSAINEGKIGKYARGRTPFRVGGQTIELNVASQQTQEAINRRIAEAASIGEDALRAFAQQLKGLTDQSKIIVSQVDASLRQVPELRGMSTIQEKDYSAPEFIRRQTEGMDWESRTAEIAAVQNRVAEKWEVTEQQVANLVNTQASHLRVVDENGDRIAKSWTNVANLAPDLGAINNYLNRTERMTFDMSETSEVMQRIMRETQLSYQQVLDGVQDLRRGTHPQDEKAFSILTSLAKIDEEMSLAAIEAKETRTALGTLAKGGYQASAVVGVGQARTVMPPQGAYVAAEEMTSAAVAGAKAGQGSASPSKRMRQVGDEFSEGYIMAINDNKDEVVRASQAMTEAAVQSVASGTSDIRVLLKEKLNVGPIVEQEQANLRENIALRKEENRLIERKMMLMALRGASTLGLRERAIAEIARERAAAATPAAASGPPFGLTMGPKSVQDDLIRATRVASAGIADAGKQASQTAKRFAGLRGGMSKFGGALKNGSMKMQGAFFALDGLVFAASMMNNSFGEIAQKALPVVFGLQGLSFVLPSITKMLPKLISPMGLAIGAVTALAAGAIYLNKNINDIRKQGEELADAMTLSSGAMKKTAEFFGRMTFEEQRAAEEREETLGITSEEAQKATEFVGDSFGKELLQQTEKAMAEFGNSAAISALASKLSRLIISGAISSKEAAAIANVIGEQIDSEVFDIQVIGKMNQLIGPNGQDITSEPIEVALRLVQEGEQVPEQFASSIAETISTIQQNLTSTTETNLSGLQGLGAEVAKLGERIGQGWLTNVGSAMAGTSKDFAALYEASAALGKSVGNIARSDFQLLEDTINRNKQIYEEMSKTMTRQELISFREEQIAKEQELRDSILDNQKEYINLFDQLEGSYGAQQKALEGAETAAREAFSDPLMQSIVSGILGRVRGEDASIRFNITTSLASGDLNPIAVEKIFESLGDKRASTEIDLLFRERGADVVGSLMSSLMAIENDEVVKTIFLNAKNIDVPQIQGVVSALNEINQLDPEITKLIYVNTFGMSDALNIASILTRFDNLPAQATKERYAKFFKNNFGSPDVIGDLEKFMSLPPETQRNFIARFTVMFNEQGGLSAAGQEALRQAYPGIGSQGLSQIPGLGQQSLLASSMIEESIEQQVDDIQKIDEDKKDKGGGGSKTETWLEGLFKEISANLKLFVGNIRKGIPPIFGELRALGIPEQLIDAIGAGPDGLKKAKELLKLGKDQRERLIKDYNKSVAGEAVAGIESRLQMKQQKDLAKIRLEGRGVEKDLIEEILEDEEAIFTILFGTNKQVKQLISGYKELQEETDPLEDAIKRARKEQEKLLDAVDQQIEAQQEVINGIQSQIDAIEERNDADQNIIRDKQRQVEMIERQIDAIERLNEADERRIESLNRESELRDRVSEALSRELDKMSEVEDDIRDAYQKRIDALDKVASINDYIIDQQRQQLDLSRAVSEGDVYAATAAAQAMRAASSGFATGQVRSALEQGMENQVAGLRTSGGLTREQAEQQIANISEQNYQTSLLIRDIEDVIYQRNLELIPLKDQIRSINDQILIIEDRIYDRETEILNITNQRLKPEQNILAELQKQRETTLKKTEDNIEALELSKDLDDSVVDQGENVNSLAKAWHNVAKEIKQARDIATGKIDKLGAAPAREQFKKDIEGYRRALQEWNADRAAIIAERDRKIAEQLAKGNAALDAALQFTGQYAGGMVEGYGMGGKIKKYRGGGVVSGMQALAYGGSVLGSGGRDSVPTMLMPGEFVIRKAMVDKYGSSLMEKINQGSFVLPKYDTPKFDGEIEVNKNNVSNINAPVYNTYDMKFAISGSNASPEDIANRVMFKMKQVQDQGIRGNRGY